MKPLDITDTDSSGTLSVKDLCEWMAMRARIASRKLAIANRGKKDRWLIRSSELLEQSTSLLLRENDRDVTAARDAGLSPAVLDRLKLNLERIRSMAEGLRQIAVLPDPVGQIREGSIRPNGLEVNKVSVPLGVIFFLYEARPNVTVDAAGLCVKSGNAVILRGGKEAFHSNSVLHHILSQALKECELPDDSVQFVQTLDRDAVGYLLQMKDYIDLVIPRGGPKLIERVVSEAKMPVLKHYLGNCHIYVHETAEMHVAERIIVNAKCQRPSVCNALESLLVDEAIAEKFLPLLGEVLKGKNVELRGCEQTRNFIKDIKQATEADYTAEYCDLILSIKVVPDLDSAIAHINRYGSQHTDAILTRDLSAARKFVQQVDSAAVMVNASTRFNDGFELGLGAEIGISTDKFHARGPCGLQELTTYKYVVWGEGQIRE